MNSDENNRNGDGSNKRIRDVLDATETVEPRKETPKMPAEFSVEELNQRYAFVIVGGRAVILDENWKTLGRDRTPMHERIRFLTPDTFEKLFANQIYFVGGKPVTAARLWMQHPDRRQYQGLTFDPSLPPAGADSGGYYNLWQGFSVQPDPTASCDIFLDHLKTNIANGNEEHFRFILGTFADMFQNPTDRKGIALVFRGKQGTGKTVVGKHIGRLIEGNYALIDDPRYITGNFNAHMANILFLQADEGFWAGDKTAEGRLKGLVTSERQMIEMKGKDSIQLPNYVHLLVTSNSGWIVPAGLEERRFAVFDVGEHCMQNHEYFAEMAAELENGGYAALLHLLLTFDTSAIDLRKIPNTAALFDQKIASLLPAESWWYSCLQRGWIVEGSLGSRNDAEEEINTWPTWIEIGRVHSSYILHCEQTGVRHKKSSGQLGSDLRKFANGLERGRGTVGKNRPYIYRFPSLADCRAEFEKRIGTKIDWETGEPLSTSSTDEEEA